MRLHVHQISVIEVQARLARDNVGIPHVHPVRLRQRLQIATEVEDRVSITLQQAATACESCKTAWFKLKSQLANAEQEYREQLIDTENRIPDRLRELRDIIDVKKWEVNQAAGLYIRAHEEVQRISIRTGLDDFMQQDGAALAAILARK